MARRYLLLDASVLAAYYLPQSARRFPKLAERARLLIDSVRANLSPDVRLLTPSFCVAETFGVLTKYRFGRWNEQVKDPINDLTYWRARLALRNDIHNGRLIQQIELSRYHILATDLISPVDHHFQFYRSRKAKKRKVPMGTFDHLIIGMAIHLAKSRGIGNVGVITADHRLGHILNRARLVKRATAARLGLLRASHDLGLQFTPDVYPSALNLATAKDELLASELGQWPPVLPLRNLSAKPKLPKLSASQKTLLAKIYRSVTKETSESFTYTDDFEILYDAFLARTGIEMSRNTAWRLVSNFRKAGKLPRRRRKAT